MADQSHPKLTSLPATLDLFAGLAPAREAACDASESLSYSQLQEATERVAARLRRLGIRDGDRVAFMGSPGVPFWVSLLASMRAGAVWLGLNPSHTPRELRHVIADSRPRLCMVGANVPTGARDALHVALKGCSPAAVTQLGHGVAGLLDALNSLSVLPDLTDPFSSDLAARHISLLVYTSGSTGAPKGALLTGRGLVENGWWIARRMGFEPVRGLVNLPINHVGCVGDLCATGLACGGTLVFMDRFDAAAAIRCAVDRRLTWLGQVPAQFQLMVAQEGWDPEHFSQLRYLMWGGAAMPESLVRTFKDCVPDLFNGYGLTECSGTITLTDRGADVRVLSDTIGRPVDPSVLRIVNEDDVPVAPGVGGRIQLRGPHIFAGYLNQPAASEACFTTDGWLRTGDLGEMRHDGNVRLLGRLGEMFKSGGYNIYPREVEMVIEGLAGVQLCAVVREPDPLWGEVGVAFIQGDPDRVTTEALLRHCSEQLARYKVPKRFIVRSSLPLLPIGKVDKQSLRNELAVLPA
jgi:acyl-CoA synthetase (AMP-forming)/AMP-acid ligase II